LCSFPLPSPTAWFSSNPNIINNHNISRKISAATTTTTTTKKREKKKERKENVM